MNDRIGFVLMAKGQPVRTGRKSAFLRKGAKIYQYSGMARRFAREKQAALGGKVAVLRAVTNIDNPNRFDPIGFAVIDDGRPVKTGIREPTVKLYRHLGQARRVAEARQAKAVEVYV